MVSSPPFATATRAGTELRSLFDTDSFDVAVVCGSGLSEFASSLTETTSLDAADVYGFTRSTVPGHPSTITAGRCGTTRVLCFAGRVHLYEGHDVSSVVHPVRVAAELGVHTVVLTNAAGALTPSLEVGELVAICDHLNYTGANPLTGPLDSPLTRFVDMSCAYNPALIDLAEQLYPALRSGVYASLSGPSYETPSEIAALRTLGADLVGMSTVCETIAARHLGLDVAAFSLVTNKAAAPDSALSHEEVTEVGANTSERTVEFLTRYVSELGVQRSVTQR